MESFLEKASKAYYEGNPIITDEEFDALSARCEQKVGYTSSSLKIPHLFPMYSLQKVYPGDKDPLPEKETVIVTPKLDGAAVSIRYVDGILTQALTRGDGKKGIDITTKMLLLVPNKIDMMGEIQITGEVVCPSRVPNARNVAAGSLNLKSIDEFHSRPLTFVAYDLMPKNHNLWSDDMQEIRNCGINTVLDSNWDEYPHDGEVFRLNSNDLFDELGYTAHHPRGAYAFKTRAEGVVTKLLDVVWQVGKSGVVSPVAILEPVVIGEAVVKRATLHNIRYIEELGLEIGCSVEVIRSGEIIPRIVRRV